ncbi:MAG: S8 family serine peptidase [Candidatus Dependentiae bacterium]|nr:S8 family serine peptidase [Candidatus Dependentiae bacterium]
MIYHKKIQLFFLFFFIILSCVNINSVDTIIDNHVICSLKKSPKNKSEQRKYNHLIHKATHEIKEECQSRCKKSVDNNCYHDRKDSVFFVHFNHQFNSWTLYKPSFIPYDDFVKCIKKIYAKHGLQVNCQHDQMVTISKKNLGFDSDYLSLDEFEKYKKMPDDELTSKIKNLENNSSFFSNNAAEIEFLKKVQNMQKFFFWHLQIPTTGILPGKEFDIADQYKPLAWHFLLWDLAPKKGEGAHVAIIDTGASAFNLQEKEFSNIYKKNINITIPNVLQNYGYNLVSENGLDPIRQIAINFGHYCDHEKFDSDELMQKLPEWIIDFIKNKNNFQFEQYFIKNAKKDYLNGRESNLNEKGEEALKDLLFGEYGIVQSENNSFFHIVNLEHPYNEEVLLETLPAPKIIGNDDPFAAGHGTFTQGVVNAKIYNDLGISGLAPQAHVTMIKAFNDNGMSNKTTLNAALQRAISLKNPIVSMSLKITDEVDKIADAPLKELIDSIDYVVAASGNDGNSKKLHNKEAYPAKFDSVAFDVGAFKYDNGQYPVCPFTQMEFNIGPKFVAPGFDIFSSGITPNQKSDSMYVFMAGTSIAVPIITGFLALVLAEFQDIFTREQILKVIYKFSIKLNSDAIWQKYIKLGTPDMRSSMLCLHILKSLREILEKHSDIKYNFENNFDNLVQAIYTINYYVPSCYEEKIGFSCTNDFAGYSHALLKNKSLPEVSFFTPFSQDLPECISFITQLILKAINSKKINDKNISDSDSYKKLLESLRKIVSVKKINLFAKLPSSSQNRINLALVPRISCTIPEI